MEEAAKLCDHVALLNEGVIVEYGRPKEICLKYNKQKRYAVHLSDNSDHVLEQTQESIMQMGRWMEENKIESLHSCEPTLEKVFLEVTGRELS